MKVTVFVKTYKGNHFYIEVQPTDKVVDVKKQIEQVQGAQTYPSERQLLIYQRKLLKDETTMEENQVTENAFLLVKLSETKSSTAGIPLTQQAQPSVSAISEAQDPSTPNAVPLNLFPQDRPDFPSGATDRVVAAALDIFPQGLPNVRTGDLLIYAAIIDFLRHSAKFQALLPVIQENPQAVQPILEIVTKRFPGVMSIVEDHRVDILRLASQPVKGARKGNFIKHLAEAVKEFEHFEAGSLTPEEREAVQRLEAMGFPPARVMHVFLECHKNEELAVKYLREHGGDDNDNNH